MYEDLCLYIDGEFIKSGGRREQDNEEQAQGAAHRPQFTLCRLCLL